MQTIILDGSLRADLAWQKQRSIAEEAVSRGDSLFWQMDLGLFSQLALPVRDQTQYLSLKLSLEHFRDTLWSQFQESTVGCCFYRGPADFSSSWVWDAEQVQALQEWLQGHFGDPASLEEELGIPIANFDICTRSFLEKNETGRHLVRLFSRDVAVEFMSLLANGMPDDLSLCLQLELDPVLSPLHQAQLVCKERYQRFSVSANTISWNLASELGEEVKIGVCFPSYQLVKKRCFDDLDGALSVLIENRQVFRIIPEATLTAEWDGLDYLLIAPEGISSTGKRKLLGFCAAGGTIVSTGPELLGLPEEISFDSFASLGKLLSIRQ